MVAAAFGGRHHVVIHYVITFCLFGAGPAMFFRLWPLLFFGLGPAMFFRLLAPVVFRGQRGPESYCFLSFPVLLDLTCHER